MPPTDPAEKLIAEDLLLLLFYGGSARADMGRMNGITRAEKLLFLAQQDPVVKASIATLFHFEPYDYGPYSKEIYEAVALLEGAGLLRERLVVVGTPLDQMEETLAGVDADDQPTERQFELTDDGKAVAALLTARHPSVASHVTGVRTSFGDLPLRALLRYVYSTYPATATASKIRDRILS